MKRIWGIIKERWNAKMPVFFHWVMGIAVSVSGVAIAIHTALTTSNADIPEWWATLYPYLVGFGAGMAAVAKLTQKN